MNDELINDELPSPPVGTSDVDGAAAAPIDDSLDASLLTDVPKMGEAMPVGTYAFRLDSFKEQWTEKDYKTGEPLLEKQPYFALQWKCQQEPHVGRVVFENVPWITSTDAKAANDPQNPRRAEARQTINKRLPRAKEIMEAAGFQPSGQFGFKQFLGSNPELKLTLKVKERQQKGPDGKFHGTGEWSNEVVKHLSLHRPM
jgi:hypothetical protein